MHENDASFYAKERGETTVSGIFGEEFQKAAGDGGQERGGLGGDADRAVNRRQYLISSLSIGVGLGVNALMARFYAQKAYGKARRTAGTGLLLAVLVFAVFAAASTLFLPPLAAASVQTETAAYTVTYGRIVCLGSLGILLEGCFSKVHQAGGNMRRPMAAQIAGAVCNLILDPLLIFGIGPFPALGIAGAAIATVIGQYTAMLIVAVGALHRPPAPAELPAYVKPILHYGAPYLLTQFVSVGYCAAVNVILAAFSDAAVTVLGLYFKLQTFFFIPLFALQTCIVPLLSYNFTQKRYARCRETVRLALAVSAALMGVGILCFEAIPGGLIRLFSDSAAVIEMGIPAFRIIGTSFLSAAVSQMSPFVFQAIGRAKESIFLGG